jgi:hypothetical protein
MIFNQNWRIVSDETGDDNSDGTNHSSEDESTNNSVMRKSWFYFTQIFTSKRCISMYLEDAYLLHLKFVINKDANVVTLSQKKVICANGLLVDSSFLH